MPNITEMDVAKAIASGELTSPQRYGNMSMFAIRITGTGVAYRKSLNEFVYRPPENYLNAAFVERCAGLPVIVEHPEGAVLNSEEFRNRIIGSTMFGYINEADAEVWAIARIYDDAAIQVMQNEKISTSPTVVFRDETDNEIVEMEDGAKLLIEGEAYLLDHIAICYAGVWDKYQEPSGVLSE